MAYLFPSNNWEGIKKKFSKYKFGIWADTHHDKMYVIDKSGKVGYLIYHPLEPALRKFLLLYDIKETPLAGKYSVDQLRNLLNKRTVAYETVPFFLGNPVCMYPRGYMMHIEPTKEDPYIPYVNPYDKYSKR